MGCTSSSTAQETVANKNLPKVIFVTGAPGSGKRTQCAKLVEKYGFTHISTYEAIKAEAAGDSEAAQALKKDMDSGKLIDSNKVIEVLDKAMQAKPSELYVIEGFPKNKDNVDAW